MTTDANVALVRRFYEEVWGRGDLDVADDVFAPDYERHDLRPGTAESGPEGQKQIAAAFRGAVPDLRLEIDLVFGAGDHVAARWTMTGTHLGVWGDLPASGRPIRFSGVNLWRFADGKAVEIWNHRDDLGLREQLGVPVYAGAPPQEQG